MIKKFTDRARYAVVLAQEEARMLNYHYVGTQHILLGLIHEGDGIAAKSLGSFGITIEGVRSHVNKERGKGLIGTIPFTPRAHRVLSLSYREMNELGHDSIGTEHILLGLIREGSGVATKVLINLGAGLNDIRQAVIQTLVANRLSQ